MRVRVHCECCCEHMLEPRARDRPGGRGLRADDPEAQVPGTTYVVGHRAARLLFEKNAGK